MAEETRKFYITDLIRARREFINLQVPAVRVDVVIQLSLPNASNKPIKAKAPTDIKEAVTKMAGKAKELLPKLEKAARDSLSQSETELTAELRNKEKLCVKFADQGRINDIARAANEANSLLENAVSEAKATLKKVVEYTKAKEARGNDLLLEAKLKTSVKFSGIAIKSNAPSVENKAENVGKCLEFANDLKKIGTQVQQNLNSELRLRKNLVANVIAHLKLLAAPAPQAAEQDGGKVKDIAGGTKAQFANVEKALQLYHEHTVKLAKDVNKVFEKSDDLMEELRKHPKLTDVGKLGTTCVQAKLKARTLGATLSAAQANLKGIGLTATRAVIVQKIKALDVGTILSEGTGLISSLSSANTLMSKVASVEKKKPN